MLPLPSYYQECEVKKKVNSNLLLLRLVRQDTHSSYNKDDIWILNPGKREDSLLLTKLTANRTYYF